MKKAILLLVAIAGLVAFTVSGAFATIASPEQENIDSIYEEMLELRKQLIDSYVASGQITEEQGIFMKERMEAAKENKGQFQNRGFRNGGGCGAGGGLGRGCGGAAGCSVVGPNTNVPTTQVPGL